MGGRARLTASRPRMRAASREKILRKTNHEHTRMYSVFIILLMSVCVARSFGQEDNTKSFLGFEFWQLYAISIKHSGFDPRVDFL